MSHPFRQVNVFSADPVLGNPVAVVHDADGLSEEQMAAFARWTNLSETTFLLRPTDPASAGIREDPVTGSLSAGLAQWLSGDGTLPPSYVAAQGTALGRAGRLHIDTDPDGTIWVGGDTVTTISGTVSLG